MATARNPGLSGDGAARSGVFGRRRSELRLAISRAVTAPTVTNEILRPSRALAAIVALLLGVSALLFGTVHPWAYWPVGVTTLAVAAWMFRRSGAGEVRGDFAIPALLILVPVLVQAIPMPRSSLDAHAPSTVSAVELLEVGFASEDAHSLSVSPALTLTSLGFLLVGAVWVGSISRGLRTALHARDVVSFLICVSVAIAIFALMQTATFNGKIYWLWESQFGVSSNYFGSFVNRNHFAGWMLLATSLGAGHCLGLLTVAGRSLKPGWRERILWLGTPEASRVTLTAVGVAVMATALLWSLSRSGVAGATLAVLILAVACVKRMPSPTRARMALAGVTILFVSVVAWRGLDTLAASYGDTRTLEWRFALWRDSVAPLRAFFTFGSGLNTYGKVMLLYPQTDAQVHAQQAHNDYLQLAIEGGLLVVVPWLIASVMLARRILRGFGQPQDDQTWWLRMGAVAGLAGIALQEISEFSLQIPAVALLFATTLAIALHTPQPPEASAPRLRPRRTHH